MDKTQAENLKLQIIERRNYFAQLDHPLKYSKAQLHGGMQNRVARQEDRSYMKDVRKGGVMAKKNLTTINKYLDDLNTYNSIPQEPIVKDGITFSTVSVKVAPVAPKINLTPNVQMRRKVRRGIISY